MKSLLLSILTGALAATLGWFYLRLTPATQRRLLPWILVGSAAVIAVTVALMFRALVG